MKKDDCLSSEKLILYSDGSLSKEELKEVEEHLENCHSCREEVEYLKNVFTDIQVASVCPSADELIEYNPEGTGSRDIFIKSHIKFCSKCKDILDRLSIAVEQFDEPPKEIKTTKLPEKVSKEIERYYPEQKKMSFWQFLSSFFFSKKNIAVFSSIFVIICCLLIFKFTFVPQMFGKSNMASLNEKISTESNMNNKDVDSAKADSDEIDPNREQNEIIDKIISEIESEDSENINKKSEKIENTKVETNTEKATNITDETEKQKNNLSNKNSNNIDGEYSNKNSENFINKHLENQEINNRNISSNEENLEDTSEELPLQESEEMRQLRREYMQGAEVEIHDIDDNKAKSVVPSKSEPSKSVEKPVKRYVIPIKPIASTNSDTVNINSYSSSLTKSTVSSDRISQNNDEYRKDTSSDNEIYKQLRKKLIKDREEPKKSEEKVPESKVEKLIERTTPVNAQSVLPTTVSAIPKEEKKLKEKKHTVTKEQILQELHKQQEVNSKKEVAQKQEKAISKHKVTQEEILQALHKKQEEPNKSKTPTTTKRFVRQEQPSKVSTPVPKSSVQLGNAPVQVTAQPIVERAVDMKSNSSSGMVIPNNNLALSKSASSSNTQLSISPLALEYKINMEIGYGSITITSVNEGGTIYYEIKQNRTLTDDDLVVVNRICGEYRDIKIRFK